MSKIRAIFIVIIIGFGISNIAFAQSNDGIAMRIVPNPQHYSALRWYQENVDAQNQGAPAQLLVDGYQAVRDGRTVYVAAGNVGGQLLCLGQGIPNDVSHCSGKKAGDQCYSSNAGVCGFSTLYTNIYILSYTQNASGETQDIFGQLLNNWTFNTNLMTDSGMCMSVLTNQGTGSRCHADLDCGIGSGQYCNSAKAKVTRDVRRLADIGDIEQAIAARYSATQSFPTLTAGTYVPRRTLSVWPSWQETLGSELGVTLPVDPLNSLSSCRNDPESNPAQDGSCWNETTRQFDKGNTNIPDDIVPGFGYAYAYVNDSDANPPLSPRLCAAMETGYAAVTDWQCANTDGPRVVIDNIRVTPEN